MPDCVVLGHWFNFRVKSVRLFVRALHCVVLGFKMARDKNLTLQSVKNMFYNIVLKHNCQTCEKQIKKFTENSKVYFFIVSLHHRNNELKKSSKEALIMASFRKVEFTMTPKGRGQYLIEATYKGKKIKVSTTNSEAYDWYADESNKKKYAEARRFCYMCIVSEYNI